MMKKFILLSLMFLLLFFPTITVCAQDSIMINYGTTEEGIRYQVYNEVLSSTEDSITIKRTYIYNGNVTPVLALTIRETINGVEYYGSIRLISKTYNSLTDQTSATYQGTLYKTSRISSH